MEKVSNKSIVFKFVLVFFSVFLLFSIYFGTTNVPSITEFFEYVVSPLGDLEDPLSDLIESLQVIVDYFDGGGLPTLESLVNLLTAPFRIIVRALAVIIVTLTRLIELFT